MDREMLISFTLTYVRTCSLLPVILNQVQPNQMFYGDECKGTWFFLFLNTLIFLKHQWWTMYVLKKLMFINDLPNVLD